jgi:hypothetical protein
MEEEDVEIPTVETLLLMDVVAVMTREEKGPAETSTVTKMYAHKTATTQFVANTGDALGHNAMITQEGKAFVHQEIPVETQMVADAMIFVDKTIIVRPHHIKPTSTEAGIITISNNNNPV